MKALDVRTFLLCFACLLLLLFDKMLACLLMIKYSKSFIYFFSLLSILQVSSIKNGMWDSIYDSLQTINLHESTNTRVEKQPVYECIDVGPSAEGALIKHVPKSKHGE